MIENREPKIFYGYIIVLVAFCILAVFLGTLYSFGIFFKPLLTEFGWTRAMTSGPYSLCWLLTGFLGIMAGRLNEFLEEKVFPESEEEEMGKKMLTVSAPEERRT